MTDHAHAEDLAVPLDRRQKGRRGPYAKGVLRRQQILDRALEVFHELGFESTSLRAIGEAIGVSHAALRHYFGSREELFIEVLRENDRQAAAELRHSGDTITLGAAAVKRNSHVPGLMALYSTMTARALEAGNEHSREFFVARYEFIRGEVFSFLERGRLLGTIREDIPLDIAAALFVAASDGLSTQWQLDRAVDIEAALGLLDRLLTPRPTTA
jgi:AcrR family transcriptional regulator